MGRISFEAIHVFRNAAQPQNAGTVLSSPSPVPRVSGLYAWYFREVPPGVPVNDCVVRDGLTLLYVGIAPSRIGSKSTLRRRIRQHYRSNAAGSTLRLTLGCLLARTLRLRLHRVGTRNRLTFGSEGEHKLSEWMATNALVCWVAHPRPWNIETEIISALRPPLNIDANAHHPFCATLTTTRRDMKEKARQS
jgi:hypothetical protein